MATAKKKKPTSKGKKITKKQKDFADEYLKTGNGTQSALKAYDTTDAHTAGSIAIENLEKPVVINYIQERLPDDLLTEKHLEGLNAGKKVFKNNNATGEIEEVGFEPDYAVRHKYLDTAYKIKGSYAPEKKVNLNANVEIKDNTEAQKLAEEYEEKLRGKLLK